MNNLFNWVELLLAPLGAVAGWWAARTTRRNDAIKAMQETIDELVIKNKELVEQVIALRSENAELRQEVESLKNEVRLTVEQYERSAEKDI